MDVYSALYTNSITTINTRYVASEDVKVLAKFNQVSEVGAVRDRLYRQVLTDSKIIQPEIIIEYSSSGETFSYTTVVLGNDSQGNLCRLDYSFYSNKERIRVRKVRCIDEFKLKFERIAKIEFDDLTKTEFPSDLVILSYFNQGQWEYRISRTPTHDIQEMVVQLH